MQNLLFIDFSVSSSTHQIMERDDAVLVENEQTQEDFLSSTLTLENINTEINESSTTTAGSRDCPEPQTPSSLQSSESVASLADKKVVFNQLTGEAKIITKDLESNQAAPGERLIEEKGLKVLFILGAIATLLFFPTGIISLYFAWHTRVAFKKGVVSGDYKLAQRYSKLCEKIIATSIVLGIVTIVIVFAIIGKGHTHHSHYINPHHTVSIKLSNEKKNIIYHRQVALLPWN